jgi:hypothetical protein
MGLGALDHDEEARLTRFHEVMADLIRPLTNDEFAAVRRGKYRDEAYNNQFIADLTSELALARLFDDQQHFLAALYGGKGSESVTIPWVVLFDHVIYGPSDHPLIRVTPNNSPDPLTGKPAWSTLVVAAGEVNDRYRNDNPLQGIGYPMGTLNGLFDQAEILRIAGFDAYGYRGAHQQSIEMAVQYYACYAQHVGFYKTVTRDAAETCPDYEEYIGRIVNGVEPSVLIGAYRFPKNKSITDIEAAARAAWLSPAGSLDAVRFGRWRD